MTKPTSIIHDAAAFVFVLAIGLVAATPLRSEIVYTSECLKVTGDTATSDYGIQINNMNGISLYNERTLQPSTGVKPQSGFIGDPDVPPISRFCQMSISLKDAYPAIFGSTNRINFYNPSTKTYNYIYVAGVYNQSDRRAKQDVTDLTDGIASLMRLRPVTYHWVPSPDEVTVTEESTAYGSGSNELQYGFIAQEIEEILPDIVTTDADGNKAVNYISLIPVLVKSIQELQGQVAAQSSVIDNLNARLTMRTDATVDRDIITTCAPNPTSGEVTIGYTLMSGTTDARILITNLIGTTVCEAECSLSGTSVCLNLSGTLPGVYLATLVCNGDVRDSRQIVVSR